MAAKKFPTGLVIGLGILVMALITGGIVAWAFLRTPEPKDYPEAKVSPVSAQPKVEGRHKVTLKATSTKKLAVQWVDEKGQVHLEVTSGQWTKELDYPDASRVALTATPGDRNDKLVKTTCEILIDGKPYVRVEKDDANSTAGAFCAVNGSS